MGHRRVEQASVSCIAPHSPLSRFAGDLRTLRVRLRSPVPQNTFEHELQGPQSEIVQALPHLCVLHFRVWFSDSQPKPLCSGWRRALRLRVWSPPEHLALHDCHAVHELSLQFTGQDCVLHFCCSWRLGHLSPPNLTPCIMMRFRCCIPSMPSDTHGSLHLDHSPHFETRQFTGQG